MKILLIDDSQDTGALVQVCLAPYELDQAYSIKEAGEMLAANDYSLLIIDVVLPDGNGFSFCEKLARTGQLENVPKIFLTGHTSTSDKVFGLNCGADDYVTKPFALAELRARVDSRLRGLKPAAQTAAVDTSGFVFESDFQRCTFEGTDLALTPTEFRLLLLLAKAAGKPLSRQEIVRSIWTQNGLNIEKRGIDSHIAHLRKKLPEGSAEIVSVYGKGYALAARKAA